MILHFWSTLKYHVILFCRHDDPDPTRINTENKCYCLQDEGFKCLPSGAMYIEPCKRADQAPVARFHVSGTWWYTFEIFNFETITFVFSIVPCWSWVIMYTKKIRWCLLSFNNIITYSSNALSYAKWFVIMIKTPLIECPQCFVDMMTVPDPTRNNTKNECYWLQDEGFKCLP